MKSGYSQIEVAGFLELNNSGNISRWEKGEVIPGLIHLYQLAALYKIPVSDLYPSVWNIIKTEMNSKIQLHEKKKFIDDVTSITCRE